MLAGNLIVEVNDNHLKHPRWQLHNRSAAMFSPRIPFKENICPLDRVELDPT